MHKSPAKRHRDKLRVSDLCLECGAELGRPFQLRYAYCDDCKQRHIETRIMWRFAQTDKEQKETIALGQCEADRSSFNIHPLLSVKIGDVLVKGYSYIHPALSLEIPRVTNTRARRYWIDLIETLPKRRHDKEIGKSSVHDRDILDLRGRHRSDSTDRHEGV